MIDLVISLFSVFVSEYRTRRLARRILIEKEVIPGGGPGQPSQVTYFSEKEVRSALERTEAQMRARQVWTLLRPASGRCRLEFRENGRIIARPEEER